MPLEQEDSVARLLSILKGEADGEDFDLAVEALWGRYFEKMVRLAGNRLRKLASAGEPLNGAEDVALSAFHSLCKRAAAGEFPRLNDRDDLWKLLVTLTARKAAREYRRKHAGTTLDDALDQVVGREPTPEFAATVADTVRHLLTALPKDAHRAIALRKLEGYTNKEIAGGLGCSTKNVEYKLRNIRVTWLPLLAEEPAEDSPR